MRTRRLTEHSNRNAMPFFAITTPILHLPRGTQKRSSNCDQAKEVCKSRSRGVFLDNRELSSY